MGFFFDGFMIVGKLCNYYDHLGKDKIPIKLVEPSKGKIVEIEVIERNEKDAEDLIAFLKECTRWYEIFL